MRLATSCRLALATWLLALAAGPLGAAEPDEAPSVQKVHEVVQTLKADPDRGGSHKEKNLRFKKTEDKKPERSDGSSLRWLRDLVEWMSATARWAVWAMGAALVALLLVGLRRWAQVRGQSLARPASLLPSHVRNLDIRPESLPDAIGAAAAALWHEGAHLPALSLLYRGALSRLVHVHAVPIRGASTEDECTALARKQLNAAPADFVAALVAAWQLAVYGARLPETDHVTALCRDFDLHLGRMPSAPSSPTSIASYKVAA